MARVSAPLAGWTPVRLGWAGGRAVVDWIRIGDVPFADPFFEQTVESAMRAPFNLAFRRRLPIESIPLGEAVDNFRPAGLIFHMSHCGSTLISAMLRAVARNTVIVESAAIDGAVWAGLRQPELGFEQRARLLRAIAAAIAYPRPGPVFLKLHALHALHLPLFASAFPGTPWAFVFREPVAVLVAQARRTGSELLQGVYPPDALGSDAATAHALPAGEYVARALATVCDSAIGHASDTGTGSFLDYATLPGAVFDRWLPALDVTYESEERAAMSGAATFDAKAPSRIFRSDSAAKLAEATPEILAAARSFLERPYRAMLERAAHP
jgi:hypothetical protein